MKDETINVLLEIGIPAGIKGFTYICEAMELFDTEPYYEDGKICSLYADVAKRHGTTASRVERAIRHAFEVALQKGNREMIEHYLDAADRKNSNLLRTLYLRLTQRKQQKAGTTPTCGASECIMKQQIYAEAMEEFSKKLEEKVSQILLQKIAMQIGATGITCGAEI